MEKLCCRNPGAWPLGGTEAAAKTRYTQVADHRPSSAALLPVPCSHSSAAGDHPPPPSSILKKVVPLMGRTIKKAKKAKSKKAKVPYRTLFLES